MWAARVHHSSWTSAAGLRLTSSRSIASAPCALRSVLWAPTEKQTPSDAAVPSHQLLLRAGFVRKSGHGVFALLPLGRRVVAKLEALIDDEMAQAGGNRVDLPVLIPSELWKQSGRWQTRGPELMALQDRRDDVLALGPTHEESITSLVAANYNVTDSTKTSLRLYQIGRKFRDEIRPRFGLLRAREFIMKDMYSFDASYDRALQSYEEITTAYNRLLLSRLKLPVKRVEADSGNIGGNLSHEFHVLADIGEDAILSCASPECDYAANVEAGDCCPRCTGDDAAVLEDKRGIEVGHVFYLGQKYSKPFGATYTDAKNNKHPLEMGCYGLGVTRLIAATVEALHDEHGIVWPTEIAPFKVLVMSIGGKKQEDPISQAAWRIADQLASGEVAGLMRDDVLLDDRWRESPGSKLAESELVGYPYRVVVGRRFTKEGLVEVQTRATMGKVFMAPEELPTFFSERARQDKL
ncbi:hypothetical protein BBI17_002113 [Phytophthora kernoviae]|uniref:Probable proline--tRNA ligase, mitochondrial n=2 Tax=Phytophthora kernoviae TaxID=325452 RepID=A0A3R7H8H8_9STRA|nr:hypothetical protein G195_004073 [Phytophthora kernoviae 00238/432]KAG2528107.1 hypothetical protein JM16_003076 [Phytophthora kernoviae]KAG2529778.1 hypothetical protein JM18_002693 [Phytophthora kernoviae]RLN32696.1 hypothetical protein BBI17_002113 [Phytophthora kernoviae]